MIYTEIKPHSFLSDYIDGFWTIKGGEEKIEKQYILPDGCIDIIFNLGEDYKTENESFIMQSGKAYLVGTMTSFKESFLSSTHNFIGVRFKPAGFSSFYHYSSLNELTDKMEEFDQSLSPDIWQVEQNSITYLNSFYLNRLIPKKHNLDSIVKEIQALGGQVNIKILSEKNCTTVKQLERNFKRYVGIGPKEFANIIRFRAAFLEIRKTKERKNFLDIAFQYGYYDHAHLTKEIKRYSGQTPSQI